MGTTIKINAAAETDISNLRQAYQRLEASRTSIEKLRNISSAMTGETGQAVTEQCNRLEKMIAELQQNITASQTEIRNAVDWYRERDAQLAASMGGRA